MKCDETQPTCMRCKASRRHCAGYRQTAASSYKWQYLLSPHSVVHQRTNCSNADQRSLAFFHRTLAPVLSGPLRNQFWTVQVASVEYHLAGVKHAILALNSPFEHYADWHSTANVSTHPATYHNTGMNIAIEHYNKAIQCVLAWRMTAVSLEAVLVMCILFVSIEYATGNPTVAVTHLNHGISLLASSHPVSETIISQFRYLSVLPRYSGADISSFLFIGPGSEAKIRSLTRFVDMDAAEATLSPLIYRCARLSLSKASAASHAEAHHRETLQQDLDRWWSLFMDLTRRGSGESLVTKRTTTKISLVQAAGLLEVRWLVAKIWMDTTPLQDEYAYDAYINRFRRVVSASIKAQTECSDMSDILTFNIGYTAPLFFTTLKCRQFDIRLKALSLMEMLFCRKENAWHQPLLCAVARRTIELEHEVRLYRHGHTYITSTALGPYSATAGLRVTRTDISAAELISKSCESFLEYRIPFQVCTESDGPYTAVQLIKVPSC